MKILEGGRFILESIFDTILPPRARSARTKARTVSDLALTPQSHTLLDVQITTLFDYQSKAIQDTIQSLKYDSSTHAARLLAEALADYLCEEIASLRAYSPRPILLVPVPLHASRKRERGFNQMEKVLRELPHEFHDGTLSTISPHALSRIRKTPPQTRLSRAERLHNVQGAFEADGTVVRNTTVILLDDVATTGATLVACTEALQSAGAAVTPIALARA